MTWSGICTTPPFASRSCSGCATSAHFPTSTRCARRSRRTAAARAGCSAAFRCRIVAYVCARRARAAVVGARPGAVARHRGRHGRARSPSRWATRRSRRGRSAPPSNGSPPAWRPTAATPRSPSSSARSKGSCWSRRAAAAGPPRSVARCPPDRAVAIVSRPTPVSDALMRLYNTLTRREEEFAPSRDNTVRMYTCGLTVYARGHIGNFRTFVVCRRAAPRAAATRPASTMHQVMNFTDVDDRTIAESQKAGVPLRDYTERYIEAFREDAAALGLEQPEETPRATDDENIAAMGADDRRARGRTATPTAATGRSTSRSRRCPTTASWRRLDHSGIKTRRARRLRQVRKGRRPRLRAVEGDQAGRADLGSGHRPGPARLAHRVLGDGAAAARRAADRHPRRRRRPDLPAPRERDRAERRGDRRASSRASGSTSST